MSDQTRTAANDDDDVSLPARSAHSVFCSCVNLVDFTIRKMSNYLNKWFVEMVAASRGYIAVVSPAGDTLFDICQLVNKTCSYCSTNVELCNATPCRMLSVDSSRATLVIC